MGILMVGMALCQGPQPQARTMPESDAPMKEIAAINNAAIIYFSWLKQIPTSLRQLGPGEGRVADRNAADLISSDLASGDYHGYRFTLNGTKGGWIVRAVPAQGTPHEFETTYSIESRVSQTRGKLAPRTPRR